MENDAAQELLHLAATSVPRAELNLPLLLNFQKNRSASFATLLNACNTKLQLGIESLIKDVGDYPIDQRWSPGLHVLFSDLARSMTAGDVCGIFDCVMKIKRGLHSLPLNAPLSTSSILSESWEESYVNHLRSYDQKDMHGKLTIARPFLNDELVSFHQTNILAAYEMIRRHDGEIMQEIEDFVTSIKIFHGRVLRGDTSNRSFGAVWLRVPEPEDDQVGYWIEHIVHEVSHMRLELFRELDAVVLNPRSEKKYKAPIRDDPRPMQGVFHATFVLARMIRVFKLLSLAGYEKRFRDRLQLCRLQFQVGMETLRHPDARFTDAGREIISTLTNCGVVSSNEEDKVL